MSDQVVIVSVQTVSGNTTALFDMQRNSISKKNDKALFNLADQVEFDFREVPFGKASKNLAVLEAGKAH